MIFVYTKDYRQFQSFMQEFHLREDFTGGFGRNCSPAGCTRGQVRYISSPVEQHLAGLDHHNLVLAWGTWRDRRDASYVQDFCTARGISFVEVPETRREQEARRQHADLMWRRNGL
jgi:hypothetical protein